MVKQKTIENVEDLRRRINREFLIRLTMPQQKSMSAAPQYRGQGGQLIVTFYPR